jgi:hypothetical protein
MTQRLLVALLTVLVFASGFAARVWTESKRALPPPPVALGAEFAPPAPAAPMPVDEKKLAERRAQIISDVDKLGPQIAMYRARLEELDTCFDRDFNAILTDAQRETQAKRRQDYKDKASVDQKKRTDKSGPPQKSPAQLTYEDIERGMRLPLSLLLAKVTVSEKLKRLIEAHNLDAAQQMQARRLLTEYREKFLDLVDSIPPTSFRLSGLAHDVQKLAPTPAPAPASIPTAAPTP